MLRQNYPVEIPDIPLLIIVDSRKEADNTVLIQDLIKANKRRIPTLAINKIRWLKDVKTIAKRKTERKTRSTLILSASTQVI